jgi:hypothetical protein
MLWAASWILNVAAQLPSRPRYNGRAGYSWTGAVSEADLITSDRAY